MIYYHIFGTAREKSLDGSQDNPIFWRTGIPISWDKEPTLKTVGGINLFGQFWKIVSKYGQQVSIFSIPSDQYNSRYTGSIADTIPLERTSKNYTYSGTVSEPKKLAYDVTVVDIIRVINQEVINLVSNLPPITTSVVGGQISPGAWGSSSFTIGTNPFVLTSITLRFAQITAATPPNNLFVRLYNDNAGTPGSEITSFTFTNPGSITTTTANNIFTLSTPQTLAANTTFWLVVGSGSGQYVWALTNSVNETGESGWSIGNNSSLFSSNQGGTWTSYNNLYFQFSVNGQSYSPVAGDP